MALDNCRCICPLFEMNKGVCIEGGDHVLEVCIVHSD